MKCSIPGFAVQRDHVATRFQPGYIDLYAFAADLLAQHLAAQGVKYLKLATDQARRQLKLQALRCRVRIGFKRCPLLIGGKAFQWSFK